LLLFRSEKIFNIPFNNNAFRWLFPHFFGNHTGSHEDIRSALDAYHRELSKLQNCPQSQISGLLALQQQAAVAAMSNNNNNNNNNNNTIQGNGMAQDLSLPKDRKDMYLFAQRKDFTVKVNGTDVCDKESETMSEAMKQAGSAFSLVRPKTEQSELFKCKVFSLSKLLLLLLFV